MNSNFVDGVAPRDAMYAPSAIPKLVPHVADPADRFADQMRTFDRMRATERAFRDSRSAAEREFREQMSGYSAEFQPGVPR